MLRLQGLSRSAFNFYNGVLCVLFLRRLCNRCTFHCSSNLLDSVWKDLFEYITLYKH